MLDDLRTAVRALVRSPAFAVTAILSLALGIGANVAVFSVLNTLLIRPLPVPDAGRLVRVWRTTQNVEYGSVSYPEYQELRDAVRSTTDLFAHYPNSAILTVGQDPRPVWLELVSANYFSALGVRPFVGRAFVPDDDRAPGASPLLLISHALWRRRFGGDADVVGRSVRLNGRSFTIAGVAPPEFRGTFTGFAIDAWVPVSMQAVAVPSAGSIEQREDRFLMLAGRLRPGVRVADVRATLATLAERLHRSQRDTAETVRLGVGKAGGVHPFIARIVGGFLALLQGVVLLVLVMACVNLANILLVRASQRRRELAVRLALGAPRWRLARLVLAESLVIATAGGALGLMLAIWLGRVLARLDLNVGIPVGLTLSLDMRVILIAIVMTILTGVAFGAGPALAASRAEALHDLRVAGSTADRRRSRLRGMLVGAQVALATLLLVASGLLLRSIRQSTAMEPGFDAEGVHVVSASPELLGYDEERGRALWEQIVERAAQVSGVRAATVALFVPLGSRSDQMSMAPAGIRRDPENLPYNIVRHGYFETLRIPIVAGRDFRSSDVTGAPYVTILSAEMAYRFFGRENALGKSVRIADREGRERFAEVIGVVRDVKFRSLGEPPRPLAYVPFGQWYRPDMVLHVRMDRAQQGKVRQVLDEIRALEQDLALEEEPMTSAIAFALIPLRIAASVLAFSGAVGLMLAVLGVYGIVAYAVSLRMREIGIRVALGAGRGAVTRLVAAQGLTPVLLGLAIGIVLALGAGQLLRSLLIGVGPADPVTGIGVMVVLLMSASAAVSLPLRRALRLDPAEVLKAE